MTRVCQPEQLEQFKSAGWLELNTKPVTVKELSDDIIIARPPAKFKGADKTLDNAINKGEE